MHTATDTRPVRPLRALETTVSQRRWLRRGETLVVEQPRQWAVICDQGSLSISHLSAAHDGADDGGERMLVHALSDASLQLIAV